MSEPGRPRTGPAPRPRPTRPAARSSGGAAPDEPGRSLTLPLLVTLVRLVLAVAAVVLVAWSSGSSGSSGPGGPRGALAVGLLVVAAAGHGAAARIEGVVGARDRWAGAVDALTDAVVVLGVLAALAARGTVGWWPAAVVAAMLLVVGVDAARLRTATGAVGRRPPGPPGPPEGASPREPVARVATGALLLAAPLLVLGVGPSAPARLLGPLAWAVTGWGLALAVLAAAVRHDQVARTLGGGGRRPGRRPGGPADGAPSRGPAEHRDGPLDRPDAARPGGRG